LKIDAPITTDDIPATLEKLEAKLDEYTEKVKVWEEQREELKRKILEEGYDPEADLKAAAAEKEEAKFDDAKPADDDAESKAVDAATE